MSAPTEHSLAQRFRELAQKWQRETAHLSLATRMAQHTAYREIIALGQAAIPLILAELGRRPDHWFLALEEITGEMPIPEEDWGKVSRMAAAWIAWGKAKGYVQ